MNNGKAKSSAEEFLATFEAEKVDERLCRESAGDFASELQRKLDENLAVLENGREGRGMAPELSALLKDRLEKLCAHFLPLYAKADLLASRYQGLFRKASVAVFLLASAAVLIVSFQYIFFPENHHIILGEVAAMTVLLALIRWGNHVGWHRRWLDYRYLAERLRAGLFVSFLAETSSDRLKESWHCHWMADSWCIDHYRQLWHGRPAAPPLPSQALPVLKAFFQMAWLEDQRAYHVDKKKREMDKHHHISHLGEVFFLTTLVVAVLHVLPHDLAHLLHLDNGPAVKLMTFMAIGFPVLGFTFSALRIHFEHKKIAERSAMMARRLGYLAERLKETDDLDALAELARQTESLMVEENADWHVTVRARELEKPG